MNAYLTEMAETLEVNADTILASEFLDYIAAKGLVVTMPRKPGSGRKDGLTRKVIVSILRDAVAAGGASTASYAYNERLVEMGFLVKNKVKKTPGRGRLAVEYTLTGKGKSYVNLSKNWKGMND
jgi:predicted ArsR family transcriptional regulator